MREVERSAERVAEGVVGAAVGEIHCEAGHQAPERDPAARVQVVAVAHRPREPRDDVTYRLEPDRHRERTRVRHDHAADPLRERVDAGVRRRLRWQADRQQRIDERVLGAEEG